MARAAAEKRAHQMEAPVHWRTIRGPQGDSVLSSLGLLGVGSNK